MNKISCESDRLVEFLECRLPEREVIELEKHLDDCTVCAHQLEQLAADQERWDEARFHLSRSTNKQRIESQDIDHSKTMPYTIRQVVEMLDPTDDPGSMGRLGTYEVVGVVGSGAMGVVLKAVDKALDRIVALKVMNPTLAACGTARHRFAREARAAAGVLHPNVIAIHGVSTDRDLPYLVMPYIAGTSLQQRMDRQGPLKIDEILRIASQIAAGLAAAHRKGLIHRDIKPSNVMLDEGVENALITDFGLALTIDDATMTKSGAITGTPEYMSPEQARGDSVDCTSDVFSLGSLLYALCTGSRPFRAKTSFGVLRKITDEEPTPIRDLNPDIPSWLSKLVERLHSKSASERPKSQEVHELLEGCLAHIYQPDRIPLPEQLVETHSPNYVSLPNPILIGGFTIMTFVFIAIVFAAMQTGGFLEIGNTQLARAPKPLVAKGGPTVFKTHNLMFPKLGQKGILEIDINRGFVEVTGHDEPGVVIEILTPPEFEKSQNQDSKYSRLFSPKYDLRTDQTKNQIKLDTYNQDFVLNLRIKVPRNTDLSLDNYVDGYLEVNNVEGVIKTRSEHSDIRLLNIAGSATARSRNGNLTVSMRDVADDAKLDFESYNGAIDLALPESVAVTTALSSGRGSFLTEFKIAMLENGQLPEWILSRFKTKMDEYQFGKINGGGIPLRIENENGLIRIQKSE